MPDFLAENNVCGQTILELVSRGNSTIAELLRLKDYIPKTYKLESREDVQTYGDIILDFSYFKAEEAQNNRIENLTALQELDEEFKENNIEIINRFYLTLESIHDYVTHLSNFLEELEEGFYIHQSLETIFGDVEGKQLLCEALYLYGLMLLIADLYIEGNVRERLLVSYYRYNPQRSDTQSRIDDVCKLLRDTGFSSSKKPQNYPEEYFRRIPLPPTYIDIVIGHLRSDDIYSQLSVYPLPKHRTLALAHQASMLYICLYFSPHILHSQTAIMREIVDKYFPDNWTISIHMGITTNLIEAWEPFKAAKMALNNTLEPSNIKSYSNSYSTSVPILLAALTAKLKDGNLTKDTLLKDIHNIINLLRDCNFGVRWWMLHTLNQTGLKSKRAKQIRDLVTSESSVEPVQVFKLLLSTAQLELNTRDIYRELLEEKENQWEHLKKSNVKNLVDLSEVFSGSKPLTRVQKNPNLQVWFHEISKQVDGLGESDSRKIVQLIQALEEVQEFHQLDSNMQIMQFLVETRKGLDQMIRIVNVRDDDLVTLQIIGDLSYAWELIDCFTPVMQQGIRKEPNLVIKLRSVFLKLASALEVPLLRINQAHSPDFVSVSQYYSGELETYVRKVLQIIPEMMFGKMARIIEIQTGGLKELPTRLDKDKMREFAQLSERFEFAELTHSISVFSQGMRMMKSTLVGVICLDPKRLLEDGIRKELVQYVSKALHSALIFSPKLKSQELEQRLQTLGKIMDGYKRSFEYIQDYININGLKIWQEEVGRIINFNVQEECNGFLRNKVKTWEDPQSRHVPIPVYTPTDNVSRNFIGRLAREIMRLTDPRQSVHIQQTCSWYDPKTHRPVFNKSDIALIASAIEVSGLTGLDRLFSFMIVTNLQKISRFLANEKSNGTCFKNVLASLRRDLLEIDFQDPGTNASKFYQNCINRSVKIWNGFLDCMVVIGQLQLLRNLIAFHLNKACRFNAKNLEASLRTLNSALLLDITNSQYRISEELASTFSHYFDYSGLHNTFNKIYITSNFDENYAVTIFIFVIAHLNRLFFQQLTGVGRRSDQIDGTTFAAAIHTLVKQFNGRLNENFIDLLTTYSIQLTRFSISTKNLELPLEVALVVRFLEAYSDYSESSRKIISDCIPDEILHLQQSLLRN